MKKLTGILVLSGLLLIMSFHGRAQNIALNKPAYASSVQSGTSFTANLAVDGNYSTRWSSAPTDVQSIYVDLGSSYNISRVKIAWETALGKNYNIDVSTDGSVWTPIRSVTNNTSLTNDNTGLSGTGRYVMIYCTQRGSMYGYSMFELEIYGTASTQGGGSTGSNLALNRPASVSSVQSGSSYTGNLAVDGKTSTRWSSNSSDPQWLYVDLGSQYSIGRVKITWESAYGKDYHIDVSNDASTWTTIKSISGNTSLINDNTVSGTGRYVRVYGTQRGTIYGYSIYELEVYGSGTSSTGGTTGSTGGTTGSTGGSGTAGTGGTTTGSTGGGSGKKYYFSSSTGDDSRTSTQAQSSSTPWKTISKLNSFFSSLQPGDNVYFKAGDTFYGAITFTKSGSSSGGLYFGAYGSGNKPVITGLSDVSGWTSIGTNKWESSAISNGQSSAMIVLVNGTSYPMGRWPNATDTWGGFRKITSHSGSSSISDGSLPSSPNWTGATLVMRKNQYTMEKGTVTSQSGTTLNYSSSWNQYAVNDGYGYFVENSINTLDQQNEWYYNPSTKKLDIYSTSTPSNVKISTVPVLFDLTSRSYLSFDNLNIQGSVGRLISITGSSHITFTNCNLNNAGSDAIYGGSGTSYFDIENSTINNSNHTAITLDAVANNTTIRNNTITNTSTNPGMFANYWLVAGVYVTGNNNTIEKNTLQNTGSTVISFNRGSNNIIRNNFINNFQFVLDEGGGIYTNRPDGNTYSNNVIDGNIVINGMGAAGGKSSTKPAAEGIYLDNNSQGVSVINNSVANIATYGIFLLDAHEINILNNTVYNCGSGTLALMHNSGNDAVRNVKVRNNKFVMTASTSIGNWSYQTGSGDLLQFGSSDSNVVATPTSDNNAFYTFDGSNYRHQTVAQWQSFSGQDMHSKPSPKTVASVSSLRFEYNASSSSKTVSLGAGYIDIKGVSYPSSITLAPWSSAVLISASATNLATNTAEVLDQNNLLEKPSLTIYPNPVRDNFILQLNNSHMGKMNVQVVNQAGAIVHSYLFNKDQIVNQITVPANDLPTGVYFVHVQIGTWSDRLKIVKL